MDQFDQEQEQEHEFISSALDRKNRSREFMMNVAGYVLVAVMAILLLVSVLVGTLRLRSGDSSTPAADPDCVLNKNAWKLPLSIEPTFYAIDYKTSLLQDSFTGSVSIDLNVKQATTCVLFHAEDLELSQISLAQKSNSNGLTLVSMKHDNVTNMVRLNFKERLQTSQQYKLTMAFAGTIRNDLRGLYRSYQGTGADRRPLYVTQFEPLSARTAFPCWDEPIFKAQFQPSFTLPSGERDKAVLTNGKELANSPQILADGSVKHSFEPSPKMSSYLVAYILGDLEYVEKVETVRSKSIRFRIYTPLGQSSKASFALETTPKVFRFLTEFFDIEQPSVKVDQVAIPDFRAGAMENWNLVTYRDAYLLFDPATGTIAEKQNIARIIVHELAHFWSGNLVTCADWNSLTMNEGFANFYESFGTSEVFPEWNFMDDVLVSVVQPLMTMDSLPSTHPLIMDTLNTTQEIDGVFDSITYNKGGSLLRMMLNYLGRDKFQSWMKAYFKKFAYQNVEIGDLFDVLTTAVQGSSLNGNKMRSWTHKSGYPVLTLERLADGRMQFTQKRFFSAPASAAQLQEKTSWWLPVSMIFSTGAQQTIEFEAAQSSPFALPSGATWLKANAGQQALYRVAYPESMWKLLSESISQDQPGLQSVSERFGLVDDAFALAATGDVSANTAFELALALKQEKTNVVWNALLNNLIKVGRLITAESYRTSYDVFLRDLVSTKLAQLGWDAQPDDSEDTKKLRTLILTASVLANDYTVIGECFRRYRLFSQDPAANTIAPEIRGLVYDTVIRFGNETYYNDMLRRYREATTDASERSRAMYALGRAQQPHLIGRTLQWTMTDDVRSQDGVFVIRTVAFTSYTGASLAWDFVRENFEQIVAKYGDRQVDTRLLQAVVTPFFASNAKADEVRSFAKGKSSLSEQYVQNAVSTIEANAVFLSRNRGKMQEWLSTKYPVA